MSFAAMACVAGLLTRCQSGIPASVRAHDANGTPVGASAKTSRKPVAKVQLFVMSKCPYAVKAETSLLPALERFGGEVELELQYIGTVKPDLSLSSMHGSEEVIGDIDQLCAAKLSPEAFPKFLACVNEDWQSIPSNTLECAGKTGIDGRALRECRDGETGKRLLLESFGKSEDAGAQGSPTIKIGGTEYEGPRSSSAFALTICDSVAAGSKPELCGHIPPAPQIRIVVLTDKRCKNCGAEPVIKSLKQVFPGLQARVVDWSEPEARFLASEAKITRLPAVLFDDSLDLDREGEASIARWLDTSGKHKALRIPADFDPSAEICDNEIDDTGDGKVDCADPTCSEALVCRPEKKGALDVFIMSQCPYATLGLTSMKQVLEAFGKEMSFHVHFIADMKDGSIESMHGKSEVDEDLREICVMKHYPQNNRFMDYIWCRSQDIRSEDWKKCATKGIDAKVIETCSTGSEGRSLLEADLKIAESMKIGASPTWLANNKVTFSGINAREIQSAFCAQNLGLKGCDKTLASSSPTPDSEGSKPAGCGK
jgi:predicted DsbA family dithiol-disulfide isomerase